MDDDTFPCAMKMQDRAAALKSKLCTFRRNCYQFRLPVRVSANVLVKFGHCARLVALGV
jgi:hypothetical protein